MQLFKFLRSQYNLLNIFWWGRWPSLQRSRWPWDRTRSDWRPRDVWRVALSSRWRFCPQPIWWWLWGLLIHCLRDRTSVRKFSWSNWYNFEVFWANLEHRLGNIFSQPAALPDTVATPYWARGDLTCRSWSASSKGIDRRWYTASAAPMQSRKTMKPLRLRLFFRLTRIKAGGASQCLLSSCLKDLKLLKIRGWPSSACLLLSQKQSLSAHRPQKRRESAMEILLLFSNFIGRLPSH